MESLAAAVARRLARQVAAISSGMESLAADVAQRPAAVRPNRRSAAAAGSHSAAASAAARCY